MSLAITWLGHSAFILDLGGSQRILFDPWLGNPACPENYRTPGALGAISLILLSHGHEDHAGDIVSVARTTGAPVVCAFELGQHLQRLGLRQIRDMGIGGTLEVAGLTVTMTQAVHSSSFMAGDNMLPAGTPAGFVVRADGSPTIYYAGDTALFGDMKTIGEVYSPAIAFLPIGDRYTMGPEAAAMAARWLGVRQVVPMHWGTFPALTGTAGQLEAALEGTGVEVLTLAPGETAR